MEDYKKIALLLGETLISKAPETKEEVEKMLPELRESEDERIRKSIIEFFKNFSKNGTWKAIPDVTKWIDWLEKQGEQKPVDKVESKFKVGDWVVNKASNLIYRVDSILYPQSKCYYLSHNGGIILVNLADEQNYRLWNIKDAKDGDALVSDYEGGVCITILKSVVSSNEIEMYCHLVNSELFIAQSGFSNATWHPSTKEQRDTLMKAMADAGYTFDFDKKELKKIEQNPAWSEEDEKNLRVVVDYLISDNGLTLKHINWLKSIKDRVQPQPRQEWSEEDDFMVENVRNSFGLHCGQMTDTLKEQYDKFFNKVKSLRPQSQWKPSDEQMEALAWALSLAKNCGEENAFDLRTLYEQLKKQKQQSYESK